MVVLFYLLPHLFIDSCLLFVVELFVFIELGRFREHVFVHLAEDDPLIADVGCDFFGLAGY